MSAWLDYEQAPPWWLPLSHMVTAPCWLLLGAGLLAALPAGQVQRFQPEVLALTHLLTLGVLGNVMLGALWQLLAVAAAVPIRGPRWLLLSSYLPLQAGCAALVTGFWQGLSPGWLQAGAALLLPALLSPALYGLHGLWRSPAHDATSQGMRLALVSLLLTAVFGASTVLVLSGRLALPLPRLLDNHILWAAGGWLSLLVLAVARTVIPLFLITPAGQEKQVSPERLLAGLIGLASVSMLLGLDSLSVAMVLAVCLSLCWAVLRLLHGLLHSKRPSDPSRRGWQSACLWLLVAIGGIVTLQWRPADNILPVLSGWCALAGFGLGAVLSMQGKILPFLVWLQLKLAGLPRRQLPATHDFLAEASHARLLQLHALWMLCGLAWLAWGKSIPLAMATLLLGAYWLWLAARVLLRHQRCLRQLPVQTGS